jgi:hypothetical protein
MKTNAALLMSRPGRDEARPGRTRTRQGRAGQDRAEQLVLLFWRRTRRTRRSESEDCREEEEEGRGKARDP